jgi:hypothetical protein
VVRYPQGSNLGARTFSWIYSGISGVMPQVVSDVPVDEEALVVTSRISRSPGVQSFGGAHRGRACVHVFIGVSVCACCERLRCTV